MYVVHTVEIWRLCQVPTTRKKRCNGRERVLYSYTYVHSKDALGHFFRFLDFSGFFSYCTSTVVPVVVVVYGTYTELTSYVLPALQALPLPPIQALSLLPPPQRGAGHAKRVVLTQLGGGIEDAKRNDATHSVGGGTEDAKSFFSSLSPLFPPPPPPPPGDTNVGTIFFPVTELYAVFFFWQQKQITTTVVVICHKIWNIAPVLYCPSL